MVSSPGGGALSDCNESFSAHLAAYDVPALGLSEHGSYCFASFAGEKVEDNGSVTVVPADHVAGLEVFNGLSRGL